jgi:hypothetical protein
MLSVVMLNVVMLSVMACQYFKDVKTGLHSYSQTMFVERYVVYSALLCIWLGGTPVLLTCPPSDIILAQPVCPLNDIIFCLHQE